MYDEAFQVAVRPVGDEVAARGADETCGVVLEDVDTKWSWQCRLSVARKVPSSEKSAGVHDRKSCDDKETWTVVSRCTEYVVENQNTRESDSDDRSDGSEEEKASCASS